MSLPLTTTVVLPINKKTVIYILSWTNVIIYNISLKSSLFFNSFTLFMYSNNLVICNHCNIKLSVFSFLDAIQRLSQRIIYIYLSVNVYFFTSSIFKVFISSGYSGKYHLKLFCASNKCHCSITFII